MDVLRTISALLISASLAGCIVFYRRRPKISGWLGVATIVLGSLSWAFEVVAFALTKEGVERVVLICAGLGGALLVCVYWLRFWQRKRPDLDYAGVQE